LSDNKGDSEAGKEAEMPVPDDQLRKLPRDLECPIDNIFLDISAATMPFLRKTRHTPNAITTYALLSTIASLFYMRKRNFPMFALLFNMGYLLDCMDGYFARKYRMTSKRGDIYEHIRDIGGALVTLGFAQKYYGPFPSWAWATLAGLVYGSMVHIGLQQKYLLETGVKREAKESIDKFIMLTPKKAKANKWLKLSRYFGSGTATVGSTLLLGYLHYQRKKHN
jgi:hypothetical protein